MEYWNLQLKHKSCGIVLTADKFVVQFNGQISLTSNPEVYFSSLLEFPQSMQWKLPLLQLILKLIQLLFLSFINPKFVS
jgi:hypothetical protein